MAQDSPQLQKKQEAQQLGHSVNEEQELLKQLIPMDEFQRLLQVQNKLSRFPHPLQETDSLRGSKVSSKVSQISSQQNEISNEWYAENNINEYVKRFFASSDYQTLNPDAQRAARDFIYKNKVVPFYKKRGANPPPRDYLEPITEAEIHARAEAEKPDKLTSFIMGGLSGLTEMGRSTLSLGIKAQKLAVNTFSTLLGDKLEKNGIINKSIDVVSKGQDIALEQLDKAPNVFRDYLDSYSQVHTVGDELASGVGYVGAQLPVFEGAAGALKLAGLGGLEAGTVSLKGLAGRELLQKGIFDSMSGGLAGLVLGEDALTWAALGIPARYLMRGIYNGFSSLTKPLVYLYNKGGARGVGKVISDSVELATKPRDSRPLPKTAEEAVAYVNAEELDAISTASHGKPFSQLAESEQAAVVTKNADNITEVITNPDANAVAAIATKEHETLLNISPEAKKAHDTIAQLAEQAGVTTPTQRIAKAAIKDTNTAKMEKMSSAAPTVPESDATIVSQINALLSHEKQAVVLVKGQKIPSDMKIPMETGVMRFKDGTTVLWDKQKLTLKQIKEAKLRNRLNEILEYPVSKEEVGQAIATGEAPVVVQAKDVATGTENVSVVASTSSAVETVEAVAKQFPKAEVTVVPADEASNILQERFQPKVQDLIKRTFSSTITKGETIPTEEVALAHYPEVNNLTSEMYNKGMSKDQIVALFKEEIEKAQKLANKNKVTLDKLKAAKAAKAAAKTEVTKEEATVAKAVAKATKDEAKESAQVLHIEQRDTGMDDGTFHQMLKADGYNHSNEVPAAEREKFRHKLLPAVLKKTPFYATSKVNVFTETPTKAAKKVILKPEKVLDLETNYNPTFINHVREDFGDITTDKAMEALAEVQQRLGPDIDNWLRSKGYDAIKTGGPNVSREVEGKMGRIMQDMEVEVLNPDIVKTPAKQARETASSAAKAVGVGQNIIDNANKASETIEDQLKESLEGMKKILEIGKEK